MSREPDPADFAKKGHKIPKPGDIPTTPVEPKPPPGGWPTPTPLTPEHAAAPFPIDALPGWLGRYVVALAEETQTPVDLPGMLVLPAIGGAGAHAVVIRGDVYSWTEPLNVFVAVALSPANRKSAVLRPVFRPVRDHEADERDRVAPAIKALEDRRGVAEQRLRAAQKKLASAASDSPEAQARLATLREAVEAIVVPTVPRYVADDATPEKLVGLLANNDERMIVESAEGGVFDMMAGRYAANGAPNLEVYLKGHAGDPLRVDRIGRAGETLDSPALTIAITPQPDVIRNLADKPGFRGRGLLGRFLYVLPVSPVGSRRSRPDVMPSAVRDEYTRNVRALYGALAPSSDPAVIELDDAARERLTAFRDAHESRMAPGAELSPITDWAGKLAGAVLRVAGILHLAEHVDDRRWLTVPVSDLTMANAIRIGTYLLAHARTAFALMGADPVTGAAAHVHAWIRRSALPSFTEKVAFDATRGRFQRMPELRAALAVLVDHGYLVRRDAPRREGAGRPASPVYDVNPAVFRQ